MNRLKTITSHTGKARFLAECVDFGYIPRSDIPSLYTYSPTHTVYRWNGLSTIIVETRHKHYEVWALPESMFVFRDEETAAMLNV